MKDFRGGGDDGGSELELGLGLSLGGASGGGLKLLTAQDLPSHGGRSAGAKRAADRDAAASSSPPAPSQVVGWPPIKTHRMISLASQTRPTNAEEGKMNNESDNKPNKATKSAVNEKTSLGFVKVNMDGVQIGRKVDLNAHSSYESLARAIEDMFFGVNSASVNSGGEPSKLLDGSTDFVLTYEDKEGDWMLVGDVPFRMFQDTVKRLRIMRTSEANGLAPRLQERNDRPRSKPI